MLQFLPMFETVPREREREGAKVRNESAPNANTRAHTLGRATKKRAAALEERRERKRD